VPSCTKRALVCPPPGRRTHEAIDSNPDVVDLTMRGWTLIWRGQVQPLNERREGNNEARAFFDRALNIDPNDADALAGSAYTHFVDFLFGWSGPETGYEEKCWDGPVELLRVPPIMFGPVT
jgi:hypothetical protein